MTVVEFVRMSRQYAWLIIGSVIIASLLAFGYAKTRPVLYSASSIGFVTAGTNATMSDALQGSSLAQQKAMTYQSLVTTTPVAKRVIAKLKLTDVTPAEIAGGFSVNPSAGSQQITFNAVASTPEAARDYANALGEAVAAEVASLENAASTGQPTATSDPNAPVVNTSVVKVIPTQQAVLPAAPFTPNIPRIVGTGAVIGLIAGYLLAFMRRQFDSRIRHAEDIEQVTEAGVLGIIPLTNELEGRKRGGFGKLGIASESLRQLRTNLRFVDIDHHPRSFVVTSASPGEGKSTVSVNLARVLAASGQRVVLIDGDLRRPVVHTVFGLDGSVGLTHVLTGDIDVTEAMQDGGHDDLKIISSGRIPPNPSELVGSQQMRLLVERLSEEYIVIIDAPPLLPVTDAGLLSALCDGTVLVLASKKVRKEQLELCLKILGQVGARVFGCVLNMVPRRGMSSAYYGYGYGYIASGGDYDYYSSSSKKKGKRVSRRRSKRSKSEPSEGGRRSSRSGRQRETESVGR
ncbi:MAG: polysaccharide biosynthesis tyrosine autokinase [Nostocoides sp.]